MHFLLISDIHSNYEALSAVLKTTSGAHFDDVWVLGDITGYGPDPKPCLDLLQTFPNYKSIMGNHDRVVSGKAQPFGFNTHAMLAAYKNRALTPQEDREKLALLPEQLKVKEGICLYHGSPLHPDEYLLTMDQAMQALQFISKTEIRLGFFGHTHVPAFYEFDIQGNQFYDVDMEANSPIGINLNGDKSYLINPGSVGQPRDGNPNASYLVLDINDTKGFVTLHRVEYAISGCQEKMRKGDFPEILIKRLSLGF